MTNPDPGAAGFPTMPITGAQAIGGVALRCFGRERLVMIMPKREQMGRPYGNDPSAALKRELVCDVVVLDGGPVNFGGEANNDGSMKKPDTMTVDVGAGWFVPNVIIRGTSMHFSLDAALPNGVNPHGSAVVGRLWQDPAYRNAWKLRDKPDPADLQKAVEFWAAFTSGAYANPVPRLLASAAPAQQVSYAPQVPQQPAYAPPAPQNWGQPAPQVAQVPPAPPGWDPMVWAGLPEAHRAQVLASFGYGQPAPAPVAPLQQPSYGQQQFAGSMAPINPVEPQWPTGAPAQAAPVATMPPPPPGWDTTVWAGLTEAQRAQIMGVPPGPAHNY